uniref:Uncharacterized protein n=1 Tax=Timema genevievae TaxID=629358 RepID=A0A7R9PKJ3_TIMGE|nr:unnamed protein product [Timema genevievae]
MLHNNVVSSKDGVYMRGSNGTATGTDASGNGTAGSGDPTGEENEVSEDAPGLLVQVNSEENEVSEVALTAGDQLERSGSAEDDALHLKRRVGLFSGVALIVGTMIGSGIFVSPSGLLIRTGSVGLSFIIWIACGLLSLLEYAYFMDAFGALPAFLFSWVSTLVLKPSQMAIICLSFAKYAVEAFVTECEVLGWSPRGQ